MPLRHLPDDGQTGSGSFDFPSHRSPEQLKDALTLVGRNPRSAVAYDQAGTFRPLSINLGMGSNLDIRRSPVSDKLQGIRHQIVDALDGPGRIDPEPRQRRAHRDRGPTLFDAAFQPS